MSVKQIERDYRVENTLYFNKVIIYASIAIKDGKYSYLFEVHTAYPDQTKYPGATMHLGHATHKEDIISNFPDAEIIDSTDFQIAIKLSKKQAKEFLSTGIRNF